MVWGEGDQVPRGEGRTAGPPWSTGLPRPPGPRLLSLDPSAVVAQSIRVRQAGERLEPTTAELVARLHELSAAVASVRCGCSGGLASPSVLGECAELLARRAAEYVAGTRLTADAMTATARRLAQADQEVADGVDGAAG